MPVSAPCTALTMDPTVETGKIWDTAEIHIKKDKANHHPEI